MKIRKILPQDRHGKPVVTTVGPILWMTEEHEEYHGLCAGYGVSVNCWWWADTEGRPVCVSPHPEKEFFVIDGVEEAIKAFQKPLCPKCKEHEPLGMSCAYQREIAQFDYDCGCCVHCYNECAMGI